ncbi:Uncharacterised protein [Mycobacteroides abscessus subsp. abscessus]|uniref:hypothetical protein n=1 Tax=Mycobacteroides abscessus TaxID=36809 RepID=UPI0009A87CE7|nr:hypothetical protein [Mycobacteroides abscessus]SKM39397.1 Uncharacterised protein [Mycobacteroides abscessus subsp. abscessus]
MTETSDLIWVCDVCGKPVRDGAGYIHVSDADRAEYRRNLTAWESKRPTPTGGPLDGLRSGGGLMTYPEGAKWRVHHAACDPRPDDADYRIPVERCRNTTELLCWTVHLMGKSWTAKETDWTDFVYRALRRNGIRTDC